MKSWIDENIKGIPLLSQNSGRRAYSSFYVTRKIHEVEGISFREYIVNRKIRQAAVNLYMTGGKGVTPAVIGECKNLLHMLKKALCWVSDVDEQYWEYFKSSLWLQLDNNFIKTYDNAKDFEYCAGFIYS